MTQLSPTALNKYSVGLILALGGLAGTVPHALGAIYDGTYYESKGQGHALVLIHGGQMDRRMWDAQFERFAQTYRTIRYDLRGFGKSPPPVRPYSYAEDLRALLGHLRVVKAHVVGLSLGAAVATDFAIVHPESVSALVLTCPGLGGFQFTNKASNLQYIVEAARDESPEKAAELWLENAFMKPAMENPALRAPLRKLAYDNRHCWFINPVLLRRLKPAAAQRLSEVRAPALIIDGDLDVSDIHNIADKLSREIPTARKEVVHGVGHIANMEKPEEFNRLTLEFLSKVK
jgi:pimeloyl-ACP methyl ester carboxylesterase